MGLIPNFLFKRNKHRFSSSFKAEEMNGISKFSILIFEINHN